MTPGLLPDRITTKITVDASGCWLWKAAVNSKGYGRVRWSGRNAFAHRVTFVLLVGPIPDGLEIDHLCRVPACVNPAHLELVTGAENTRRGFSPSAIHARKTHCPQRHPYDKHNTYVNPNTGQRLCRACKVMRREAERSRP